jgi:hypothetical protein
MPKVQRWLMAILTLAGFAQIEARASESATFECAAGPSQLCHFSILRQLGAMQSFAVQGHQRTVIAGLAPGVDWYLTTVNQPTPTTANACRSAHFLCKAALVKRGLNQ